MSTKIEWTDEVWNVVTGCIHSGSPGCDNCYAKRLFPRVYGNDMVPCTADGARSIEPDTRQICIDVGADAFLRKRKFSDVLTHPDRLSEPLRRRKPTKFFVCSMGDIFHKDVTNTFIDQIWATMTICAMHANRYNHTFQILTKRLARGREYVMGVNSWVIADIAANMMEDGDQWFDLVQCHMPKPLPNVWLGASASTQPDLERIIRDLPHVPAAVRFLSLEPLLEAIDIGSAVGVNWVYSAGEAEVPHPSGDGRGGWWADHGLGLMPGDPPKIDWVIVGCESGPKRRPMELDWARSVVEQCRAAGVPVFNKQMDIDGRVSKDMSEWPEDLRVREMP